jgi:hypothetical protein
VLKPCQRPIPDQGRVLLDNSLQLFNRNVSSTSKKYRNIPERISSAANKYRIHAGIFGFITVV